jgi:hypothetical protein
VVLFGLFCWRGELGVMGGVNFWHIFVGIHSVGEGRCRSQKWSGLLTYLCRSIYTILLKPPAYQLVTFWGIPREPCLGKLSIPLQDLGPTVLSRGMGALAHFVFWFPRPYREVSEILKWPLCAKIEWDWSITEQHWSTTLLSGPCTRIVVRPESKGW